MIGIRQIGGRWYLEEYHSFNLVVPVTVAGQLIQGASLQLPGVAPFYLKALTRSVLDAAAALGDRRFLFRFGNSAGDKWYTGAGIGGTTELTLDTLIFGDGRFPYAVVPHPVFDRSAQITMEFQDLSLDVPYTIYLSVIGSYLFPISGPAEGMERLRLNA